MSPKHFVKRHKEQKGTLKNCNCNPFQSSSSLSILDSFFICCVIYTFLFPFWMFFFKFHSIWRPCPLFECWYISWHNSLKVILTIVHSTVYLFLHRFLILRKKPTSLKLLSAIVVAAGLFISLIPTIFPTVGGKNKAESANENGTISRIMWPIIFMLGSVRNINMYTYSFT